MKAGRENGNILSLHYNNTTHMLGTAESPRIKKREYLTNVTQSVRVSCVITGFKFAPHSTCKRDEI